MIGHPLFLQSKHTLIEATVEGLLLGVPFLKERWKAATIIASVLSLLLFTVTWKGTISQ